MEKHEEQEMLFNTHQQFNEKPKYNQQKSTQEPELFCACGNNLKCEGICRETHLYRPRFINSTAKKDVGVKKQWANRCPSAYDPKVFPTS